VTHRASADDDLVRREVDLLKMKAQAVPQNPIPRRPQGTEAEQAL
jgi:hypothetical protein